MFRPQSLQDISFVKLTLLANQKQNFSEIWVLTKATYLF
jgi:hypothetical protein